MNTSRQAFLYLQASVIGTLAKFFSRFLFAELVSFGWSIILANYVGMVFVFLLSYKHAFGVQAIQWRMILKFAIVAHIGLLVVWLAATAAHWVVYGVVSFTFIMTCIHWCRNGAFPALALHGLHASWMVAVTVSASFAVFW